MSIDEIIVAYEQAKEQESIAKKEKDKLKAFILNHAGNNPDFSTDNFHVFIKKTYQTNLDTKKLYKDFPEMKDVYGKTIEKVSVDVKTKQAEKAIA